MRLRLWPRSLAWRTTLIVLAALAVVQLAGLTIHALDRRDLIRIAEAQEAATRVMGLYRVVVLTPPEELVERVRAMNLPPDMTVVLSDEPPGLGLVRLPVQIQRILRLSMLLVPLPPPLRPRESRILWDEQDLRVVIAMRLPDGRWLSVSEHPPPPRLLHAPGFLAAFGLMTIAAAMLLVWASRRLTAPVRVLAKAAERLGRDVNAPPLPETGPSEVAAAAAAFNTMAARIRRFVADRTFLISAIGHDLRTPITRMKLRAEFIDDDELRGKFLGDLQQLESMVTSTLQFGKDISGSEALTALDLPALLRTVLDEAADAAPEQAAELTSYEGPEHFTIQARPVALKRAIANLVANALLYGGAAHVRLLPPTPGEHPAQLHIEVSDQGPGIAPEDMQRVFEPFHRLESSRNRETGGTGLGLPIARNILRAHGGDVTLANRPEGGLVATAILPI